MNDEQQPATRPANVPVGDDGKVANDNSELQRGGNGRRKEIGGREGPDPTRYGDWEKAGRCIDF